MRKPLTTAARTRAATWVLAVVVCGACNASTERSTGRCGPRSSTALSPAPLDQATGSSPESGNECDVGSVTIFVTEQGTGAEGPYADVVIQNGTDHEITYGAEFSLARFNGEQFEELDDLGPFSTQLNVVGPGEQQLLRWVGPIVREGRAQPLPAGHYRYRIDPTSIPVLETQFTVP